MGRAPRIDIAGLTYHITARGNYRQNIFHTDNDKAFYIELLAHYQKELSFRLFAFVLMDNHIHLLLERSTKATLGEIIKTINGRFSKEINWRRQQHGHLFQARFYSVIVEQDPYLLELTRYIHLNPVRAAIVLKPHGYMWSSCRAYLGLDSFSFIDRSYLEVFGKRPQTRVAKYKAFLEEGMIHKQSPLAKVKEGRFLASPEFTKQVKANWESNLAHGK